MKQELIDSVYAVVNNGLSISTTFKTRKAHFLDTVTLHWYYGKIAIMGADRSQFEDPLEAIDYFLTISFHPKNLKNFIQWLIRKDLDVEDIWNDTIEYSKLLRQYRKEYKSEFNHPQAVELLNNDFFKE